MRVGVDGRSLVGGAGRGVAHYTRAVLAALAYGHPADEWLVLLPRAVVHRDHERQPARHGQWRGRRGPEHVEAASEQVVGTRAPQDRRAAV